MIKVNVNDLRITELFDDIPEILSPLFEGEIYPWAVVPKIKAFVGELVKNGIEGYKELYPGVLVGPETTIHPSATIVGPAVIGANCEIRPSAFIRGNVYIGDGSVIGNSTELKNAILIRKAQVPHFNYVGDSILGSFSHMGAGSICSNLKSDQSNVIVRASTPIDTGMRKLGAILGDHVEVGCNCVLNPGCVICGGTRVYPLNSLRGVFPKNSIVKSLTDVVEIN